MPHCGGKEPIMEQETIVTESTAAEASQPEQPAQTAQASAPVYEAQATVIAGKSESESGSGSDSAAAKEAPVKFNWYTLAAGLLMLAAGVCVIVWPTEISSVLIYAAAGALAAFGAVRTVLYFVRKERTRPLSIGGLSLGLTLLVIGALLLLRPNILRAVLPSVLGCLLIFAGFGSLQTSVDLIRLKVTRWYIPLLFALAAIACGVVVLLNPFETSNVLMVFLGAAMAAEGVMLLVSTFLFRRRA